MKGRDYTAYFIDTPVKDEEATFTKDGRNLSLKEVIEGIVAERDKTKQIEVVYWPPEDPPGDVFPAVYMKAAKSKGASKDRGHARQSESVWDVVQELALSAGLIATVVLDQIRIMKPSTIYSNVTDNVTRWYFTLGRDVEEYRVRKLHSRRTGIRVVCTSYLQTDGEVLEATWTDEDKPGSRQEISASKLGDDSGRSVVSEEDDDEGGPERFRPFIFRGITSQVQLQEIAKQIGHQIVNREAEAELRTAQMVDRKGRSVVGLRYGSAVQVDYADGVEMFVSSNPQVQVAKLVLQGAETYDAQKVVDVLNRLRLPFYVHRVKHQFTEGEGNGYRMDLELRARHQVVTEASLPKLPPPATRGVVTIGIE